MAPCRLVVMVWGVLVCEMWKVRGRGVAPCRLVVMVWGVLVCEMGKGRG